MSTVASLGAGGGSGLSLVKPSRGDTRMKVTFLWLNFKKGTGEKDHLEGRERVGVVRVTKKVITL